MVIEMLESIDVLGDPVDFGRPVDGGVELISPCAVASLDGSIELWRSGRQDVERQVLVAAGGFELGQEFGPAVDLDGLDGPRYLGRRHWRRLPWHMAWAYAAGLRVSEAVGL